MYFDLSASERFRLVLLWSCPAEFGSQEWSSNDPLPYSYLPSAVLPYKLYIVPATDTAF